MPPTVCMGEITGPQPQKLHDHLDEKDHRKGSVNPRPTSPLRLTINTQTCYDCACEDEDCEHTLACNHLCRFPHGLHEIPLSLQGMAAPALHFLLLRRLIELGLVCQFLSNDIVESEELLPSQRSRGGLGPADQGLVLGHGHGVPPLRGSPLQRELPVLVCRGRGDSHGERVAAAVVLALFPASVGSDPDGWLMHFVVDSFGITASAIGSLELFSRIVWIGERRHGVDVAVVAVAVAVGHLCVACVEAVIAGSAKSSASTEAASPLDQRLFCSSFSSVVLALQ
mmetsp:Transcript_18147/g.38798  ORF Transcript_18147/g.38798 Transcript_18147/m.38798 type:complete len:283 (+) Transcript_18147:1585-2433(+)